MRKQRRDCRVFHLQHGRGVGHWSGDFQHEVFPIHVAHANLVTRPSGDEESVQIPRIFDGQFVHFGCVGGFEAGLLEGGFYPQYEAEAVEVFHAALLCEVFFEGGVEGF